MALLNTADGLKQLSCLNMLPFYQVARVAMATAAQQPAVQEVLLAQVFWPRCWLQLHTVAGHTSWR